MGWAKGGKAGGSGTGCWKPLIRGAPPCHRSSTQVGPSHYLTTMAAAITRGSARFSSNHAWKALKAGSSSSSGSVSSGNAGTQATSARQAAIWTARTSRSLSASGYSTLAPSASPRRPLLQLRQDLRSCLYPSGLGRQGSCPSVFHFVRRSYADGPSPPSPTDERAEKAKDKQAVGVCGCYISD